METAKAGQIFMAKHLPRLAAETPHSVHIRINQNFWLLLSAELVDAGVDCRVMRRGNRFRVFLQDVDFVEVYE